MSEEKSLEQRVEELEAKVKELEQKLIQQAQNFEKRLSELRFAVKNGRL